MANKVRYNLKEIHYAMMNISEGGVVSYGTPVAIPGAVSINMTPVGEKTRFFADGIAYYVAQANNGYDMTLEMALFPDKFFQDTLGHDLHESTGVLVEYNNTEEKPFALLFQFDGDQQGTRHALYNCTASRPTTEGSTITDTKEPQTESMQITAVPLSNGRVKAKTSSTTPVAIYDGWFNTVWQPTEEGEG